MHTRAYFLVSVLFFILFSAEWALASHSKWNLNDVSYLFPLPDNRHQQEDLLGTSIPGNSVELLPREVYDKLPTLLLNGNGNNTLYKNSLRVVAARIDPCPELDSASCSPEIRMVWQPLEYDQHVKQWVARDAAVHCFYRLSGQNFKILARQLWDIKKQLKKENISTRLQPLDIHPAFKTRENSQNYLRSVLSVLLQHTGKNNLEKVTFVSLMTPKQWWRFGALEKTTNGQWQATEIPRLELPTVDIFNVAVNDGIGLGSSKGLDAIFNILPEEYPEKDNLFSVINKGYRFNDERDKAVFMEKLDTVARFRNPHSTNTNNLDCASCHYADATKEYISNRFPDLIFPETNHEFTNPDPTIFNLKNTTTTAKSGRNVRAFGFFHDKPVISQRTINESAVTADWMNQHYSFDTPALLANSVNN